MDTVGDHGKSGCGCGCCQEEGMNSFCAAFSDETKRFICEHARRYEVAKGSVLTYQDFDRSGLLIVRKGFLVTSTSSSDGISQGINFVKSGELVNLFALCDLIHPTWDKRWREDQQAFVIKDLVACEVPPETFRQLLARDASFAEAILVCVLDKLKNTIEYSSSFHGTSSTERVSLLLDAFRDRGITPGELTHETIGQILGLGRVTVTRAFSKL